MTRPFNHLFINNCRLIETLIDLSEHLVIALKVINDWVILQFVYVHQKKLWYMITNFVMVTSRNRRELSDTYSKIPNSLAMNFFFSFKTRLKKICSPIMLRMHPKNRQKAKKNFSSPNLDVHPQSRKSK